jgi:hypothetical protein
VWCERCASGALGRDVEEDKNIWFIWISDEGRGWILIGRAALIEDPEVKCRAVQWTDEDK